MFPATVQNNRIDWQCVSKNSDGSYVEALAEAITSTEKELISSITLSEKKHDVKKIEQVFTYEVKADGRMKVITPKQVLFEDHREIVLEKEENEKFHAYGRGRVTGVYGEIRKAIPQAYEDMGVVTNHNGQVVWERGNRKTRAVLELANGNEPIEGSKNAPDVVYGDFAGFSLHLICS